MKKLFSTFLLISMTYSFAYTMNNNSQEEKTAFIQKGSDTFEKAVQQFKGKDDEKKELKKRTDVLIDYILGNDERGFKKNGEKFVNFLWNNLNTYQEQNNLKSVIRIEKTYFTEHQSFLLDLMDSDVGEKHYKLLHAFWKHDHNETLAEEENESLVKMSEFFFKNRKRDLIYAKKLKKDVKSCVVSLLCCLYWPCFLANKFVEEDEDIIEINKQIKELEEASEKN